MLPDTFVSELEKLAGYLNSAEERKRNIQHGVIGAAGLPVASGISNLIQTGRVIPKGTNVGRWLGGNAAAGAVLSAAVPYAQNIVSNRINDQATARRRAAVGGP